MLLSLCLSGMMMAKDLSIEEAVNDGDVKADVVAQVKAYGLKNGLKNFEIPTRVLLVNDEWTPENNLVTAAFKIRRKFIYDKYGKELAVLYS